MYMPLKPTKFGIKIWARCNDSGYLQQFEIYLGSKETKVSPNGLYFDIVDQLTKQLRGENHQVFFDNLYTSLPLLVHLKRHGILAAGTVCANRKNLPPFFHNPPKMQCGEHKTFQDKNNRFLTATAWKDTGKFPVKFISTLSQPTVATHCVRRIGSSRQRIPQLLVAHQYNKLYKFIDSFDQYRSKYTRLGGIPKKHGSIYFSSLLMQLL